MTRIERINDAGLKGLLTRIERLMTRIERINDED